MYYTYFDLPNSGDEAIGGGSGNGSSLESLRRSINRSSFSFKISSLLRLSLSKSLIVIILYSSVKINNLCAYAWLIPLFKKLSSKLNGAKCITQKELGLHYFCIYKYTG